MGVIDGVADVDEPPQELPQSERVAAGVRLGRVVGVEVGGGLLEAVSPDEPHGIVGAALSVSAQAVDRNYPRVLQPAGDLGLQQEPLAATLIVSVAVEDLLQGHLAMQLGVEGDEDGAQAAPGMRAEDPEPLAVAGGRAPGISGGSVGGITGGAVSVGFRRARADWRQRGVEFVVADPDQAFAS